MAFRNLLEFMAKRVGRRLPSARTDGSYDPSYFDAMYQVNADPWNYQTSAYETQKYAATLAALGQRRWRFGFEAGCSIGVLTRQLAEHCDTLFSIDYSRIAVEAAQARCADQTWVTIADGAIPDTWPDQSPDLVVLSEVLYYLSHRQLRTVADRIRTTLASDGMVLTVHWLGDFDRGLSGEEATDSLFAALGTGWRTNTERHGPAPGYRLDVTTRLPAQTSL